MKTLFKRLLPVLMVVAALSFNAQAKKIVDANGYYNVMNAPQTNTKFKAKSTENKDGSFTTKIYKGNKLLQTFKHEATSGEVRFIDMNFDGYVDLFVGPASSRTYNTIYLYNKKTGKFVPTQEEASLNGFFLVNEKKKHFVSMGSNGANSTFYQLYTWKGNKLEVSQSLMEFSDDEYDEPNGFTTKYTLIKGNDFYSRASIGCLIMATNKLSKLPKEWQKIIQSFDNM